MNNKPVTAIIVGAGHRAFVYSELAKTNPELLKIVGVADPNQVRRKKAMEYFGFSENMCFESAEELAKRGLHHHRIGGGGGGFCNGLTGKRLSFRASGEVAQKDRR